MASRIALVLALVCVASCDLVFGLGDPAVPDVRPPADARPDAPGPCGYIGEACCNAVSCLDGTQCVTGTAGATRCLAFAGTFQTSPSNSCAAPTCLLQDPLTGTCRCPTNLGISETANLDEGCGPDGTNPMNLIGVGNICSISTLIPDSDWGGAYVSADLPECEPGAPSGCVTPNPITGGCTCPAHAEEVKLRVFVQGVLGNGCGNSFLGATLGVCIMPSAPITSLAGVFEQHFDGSCRTYSSNLAGCTCPAGSVASQLRSLAEPAAMTTSPTEEAPITFCLIEP